MLYNISYVYDFDKDGNSVLIGAKVFLYNGLEIIKKEIYVGLEFELEDIIKSDVNAHALGINDIGVFQKRYEAFHAKGIVYFPATDKYAFLEKNDKVIHWINENSVGNLLENELNIYREMAKPQLEGVSFDLDPHDPLVEICNLTLTRNMNSSNR